MKETINFELSGKSTRMTVDGMLLWVLRTDLGLTGTKFGCGISLCRACVVLVNNESLRSCQFLVKYVDGTGVITIEGLAQNENLHPFQKAFIKHDALQCGFCIPVTEVNVQKILTVRIIFKPFDY